MSCTCERGSKCEECLKQQETPTRPLRINLSAIMPGCTHPGRKPGTACAICGECCG